MVAPVHDDVAIRRHEVVNASSAHDALDHRDVEATVRLAPATADLAHLLLTDAQEHGELSDPLVEEWPPVDEHEGAPASPRHQVRPEGGLSDPGRCDEDADAVLKKRARRLLLDVREPAFEVEGDRLALLPPVVDDERHAVVAKKIREVVATAPRQRNVLRELLCTGDHAWRIGRREPHALSLVELEVLEGREPFDLVE